MRLTAEEHPEAVKRYDHIKRARGPASKRCSIRMPESGRVCSRERAHRGPHVAHGSFGRVLAVWDAGAAGAAHGAVAKEASRSRSRERRLTKTPVGLPSRSPTGALDHVKTVAVRLLENWDQVAFVLLFLVMVKFAIDVLMTLH